MSQSIGFSSPNALVWGKIKFSLLVRKIYLRESMLRFRDEYRYCRHQAMTFCDEFHDTRQSRRDYLMEARLLKRKMLSAQAKLAEIEVLATREWVAGTISFCLFFLATLAFIYFLQKAKWGLNSFG